MFDYRTVNRTQSRDCVRLASNKFDLVRLVSTDLVNLVREFNKID